MQTIESDDLEQDADAPTAPASKNAAANARNVTKKQPARKPASRSVGIQVWPEVLPCSSGAFLVHEAHRL